VLTAAAHPWRPGRSGDKLIHRDVRLAQLGRRTWVSAQAPALATADTSEPPAVTRAIPDPMMITGPPPAWISAGALTFTVFQTPAVDV